MASPFQFRHLVRRGFAVLRARALSPDEQAWVSTHLAPGEARLFWAQARPDQRHAHDVARLVDDDTVSNRARPELVRAALLHDVGKRHTRLGVIGRSLATIVFLLRLPMTRRMRRYIDHGPLGADDLARLGVEPVVEAFARSHHEPIRPHLPAHLSVDDWDLLADADHHA